MTHSVTAHLVTLTFEAALKSFWRRNALRKFLRDCHISESHISSWPDEETKETFSTGPLRRFSVRRMARRSLPRWLMRCLSRPPFPIFEIGKTPTPRSQRRSRPRGGKEADQRRASDHSAGAHGPREAARSIDGPPYANRRRSSWFEFQDWFYELLDFSEVQNRRPYVTGGRQIDGAVTIDGTTYLIELKFTNGQAAGPDIDIFRSKVESKADNTMGIFVSMSAYSTVAVAEASGRKTSILLLDASHIFLVLTGAMNLGDVIRRVRRHASQTGEAHLPVASFGG
ncbi:restriction endonuclease domain-containing protein [Ditylenchus destructor]|nr:restriction endonuclease domain-containing protein [Ditylenchus destructor]